MAVPPRSVDERARDLAQAAVDLAAGAGLELPDDLALWALSPRQPARGARRSGDPAAELGDLLERALTRDERRRGAHYTPAAVADRVVELALPAVDPARPPSVCDPSCGGGAVLLAAGRRLVAAGVDRRAVARDLLWGADLDPLAAAVTGAALALWSGGTGPAPGHVVAGDPLGRGAAAWPCLPAGGFGAVAGNPPFQGQLARATARDRASVEALRRRFGPAAVGAYTDTAALFLLAAVELAGDGARVALVQPASVLAGRDATGVRRALAGRAAPVEVWAPQGHLFDAAVQICVPVLEVGTAGSDDWSASVAGSLGVPDVRLRGGRRLGEIATVVAGFRDEYYGLVPHVAEAPDAPVAGPDRAIDLALHPGTGPGLAPLVTSGLIDVGTLAWGNRPVRFAKQTWRAPVVDLEGLARSGGKAAALARRVRRPKVLVATQTRVVEAVADPSGCTVPATPVVSVVPHDPGHVAPIEALLSSPVVSAWVAVRAIGTGLSPGALRPTAGLLAGLPVPDDEAVWREGAAAFDRWRLAGGPAEGWATALARTHRVDVGTAARALRWWLDRLPGRR